MSAFQDARNLAFSKPRYDSTTARAGDIFFHCFKDGVGHTNMVSFDKYVKVDSVDSGEGGGVRSIPLSADKHDSIVFRFHDEYIARRAALLAATWATTVSYSGGPSVKPGITGRSIGALVGSSHFGTGAQARLLKYRNRVGKAPKNVICSEMCILAYQLSMVETDAAFIKLDAKHSMPSTLFEYFFTGPGRVYWELVGRRLG